MPWGPRPPQDTLRPSATPRMLGEAPRAALCICEPAHARAAWLACTAACACMQLCMLRGTLEPRPPAEAWRHNAQRASGDQRKECGRGGKKAQNNTTSDWARSKIWTATPACRVGLLLVAVHFPGMLQQHFEEHRACGRPNFFEPLLAGACGHSIEGCSGGGATPEALFSGKSAGGKRSWPKSPVRSPARGMSCFGLRCLGGGGISCFGLSPDISLPLFSPTSEPGAQASGANAGTHGGSTPRAEQLRRHRRAQPPSALGEDGTKGDRAGGGTRSLASSGVVKKWVQ